MLYSGGGSSGTGGAATEDIADTRREDRRGGEPSGVRTQLSTSDSSSSESVSSIVFLSTCGMLANNDVGESGGESKSESESDDMTIGSVAGWGMCTAVGVAAGTSVGIIRWLVAESRTLGLFKLPMDRTNS